MRDFFQKKKQTCHLTACDGADPLWSRWQGWLPRCWSWSDQVWSANFDKQWKSRLTRYRAKRHAHHAGSWSMTRANANSCRAGSATGRWKDHVFRSTSGSEAHRGVPCHSLPALFCHGQELPHEHVTCPIAQGHRATLHLIVPLSSTC